MIGHQRDDRGDLALQPLESEGVTVLFTEKEGAAGKKGYLGTVCQLHQQTSPKKLLFSGQTDCNRGSGTTRPACRQSVFRLSFPEKPRF